jgi:hypothetical protein
MSFIDHVTVGVWRAPVRIQCLMKINREIPYFGDASQNHGFYNIVDLAHLFNNQLKEKLAGSKFESADKHKSGYISRNLEL